MIGKVKEVGNKMANGTKSIISNSKENISDKINTYSGKDVTQKVDEFTEVFGEILIGMDKELSELKNEIKKLKETSNSSHKKILDYSNTKQNRLFTISAILNIVLIIILLVN